MRTGRAPPSCPAKRRAEPLDEQVVVDGPGGGHDEVGRLVPLSKNARMSSAPSASDGVGRAGDLAAERVVAENARVAERCDRSSGSSSSRAISSRITWRSDSTSSGRNAGAASTSARMSSREVELRSPGRRA